MARKINRSTSPDLSRRGPSRVETPYILLFCEGKNTEPSYFTPLIKWLRLRTVKVKPIGDQGFQKSVVEEAIKQKDAYHLYADDPVWCVFDADPKPDQASKFNEAIELAKASGLRVAWSNQAFEYWLLLHFQDHTGGAMERADYHAKLKGHLAPLGANYDGHGSKQILDDLFKLFLERDKTDRPHERRRLVLAHRRAARNHREWKKKATSPAKMESCTTVYELVEMLVRLALPTAGPTATIEELVNQLA